MLIGIGRLDGNCHTQMEMVEGSDSLAKLTVITRDLTQIIEEWEGPLTEVGAKLLEIGARQ
jgi:hypothetical protein